MMKVVKMTTRDVDCILVVVDITDKPNDAIIHIKPHESVKSTSIGVILNKIDLISLDKKSLYANIIHQKTRSNVIFECSASKGLGLHNIKNWIVSQLPFSPSLYPKKAIAVQPERFFVSELIREKIFGLYWQEIPYSCLVDVVDFEEKPWNQKNRIYVEIWVEKKSQKVILLGNGGIAINQLLSDSRLSIEEFLSRTVYLSVRIKVYKRWRGRKILPKMFVT